MVEISQKTKMALKIAAFIIFILLVGYGIYAIFFKAPATPTEPTPEIPGAVEPGGLPSTTGGTQVTPVATTPEVITTPVQIDKTAQGGITKTSALVSDNAILLSQNPYGRGVNFYDKISEQFYTVNIDGTLKSLSSNFFPSVETVAWSPKSNQAILEFPDGSNIFYDFETQKQVTLPSNWTDFAFNKEGDKVIAKALNEDVNSRWLLIAAPDGSEANPVIFMGANAGAIQTSWSPSGRYFAFSDTGVTQNGTLKSLYLLSTQKSQQTYDKILVEGGDFRPEWSNNSDNLLYSVYSENTDWNPNLYMISNIGTSAQKKINLNVATWSNKCVFGDSETVYCAVPQTLDPGFGLVPEMAKNTPDDIIKINTATGTKIKIAIPENDINADSIFVSADGSSLLIHDANSQGIFSVNLR